jgi:type VI secretion system protein ImpA
LRFLDTIPSIHGHRYRPLNRHPSPRFSVPMDIRDIQPSAPADGVEFTEEFERLDALINAHDSEGSGPLRKGAQPFQWSQIEPAALALAAATPDLRVGLWLLRAGVAQRGIVGLADALGRLGDWMQRPAAQVFPHPADDDEGAREVHALHLSWLAGAQFLHHMRCAPLRPGAAVTLEDLVERNSAASLKAIEPLDDIALALTRCKEAFGRIDAALRQESEALGLDVHLPLDLLNRALRAVSPPTAGTQPIDINLSTAYAPGISVPPAGKPGSLDEVRRHLEIIIEYFVSHEPGHPAPIFLRRVQRMLGAPFDELMAELYPDAKNLISKLERPQSA